MLLTIIIRIHRRQNQISPFMSGVHSTVYYHKGESLYHCSNARHVSAYYIEIGYYDRNVTKLIVLSCDERYLRYNVTQRHNP